MTGWRDMVIAGQAVALVAMVSVTSSVIFRDRVNLDTAIQSLQAGDKEVMARLEKLAEKQESRGEQTKEVINRVCDQLHSVQNAVLWVARTSYADRRKQLQEFPQLLTPKKEREQDAVR